MYIIIVGAFFMLLTSFFFCGVCSINSDHYSQRVESSQNASQCILSLLCHVREKCSKSAKQSTCRHAHLCSRVVKKLSRYKRCPYRPLRICQQKHVYTTLKWIPLSQFSLRNFHCPDTTRLCSFMTRVYDLRVR